MLRSGVELGVRFLDARAAERVRLALLESVRRICLGCALAVKGACE